MFDLRKARVTALVLAIACTTLPVQPVHAQEQPSGPETDTAGESEAPGTPWDYFRAWSRLRWRWYLLWLESQRGQGTPTPEPDNAETPGDDRPGFVRCASDADPSLTCSPEQRCCRSPENVCDTLEQDCQRPDVTVGWGDDCDGPEDCDADLTCVRGKYGSSCTPANPQQGYPVLCHVDTDCSFIPETRCGADGTCIKL